MKTSKTILFIVITLVMLNNVEHLAVVHYSIAQRPFPVFEFDWLNKLHSLGVVIIFEVVVITFVREGKKEFSLFFTICIWVLSMIYYETPTLLATNHWKELTAASVYSTIFTISIYMCSEMLAQWYQEGNMVSILSAKINELRSQVKDLQANCTTWEAKAMKLQLELDQLKESSTDKDHKIQALTRLVDGYQKNQEKVKEALTCPHCKNFIAGNEAQLRSHKGHCPENPINKTIKA